MSEPNWTWHDNPDHTDLCELRDENGRMLAWVQARPHYCDRGHFQANVEYPADLDAQDGFPRYFMRLDVAMRETEDFLRWRLLKERASRRTDILYDRLLTRIEQLMCFDPPKDSADGTRLDELVTLCEAYEKVAFPEFATKTPRSV